MKEVKWMHVLPIQLHSSQHIGISALRMAWATQLISCHDSKWELCWKSHTHSRCDITTVYVSWCVLWKLLYNAEYLSYLCRVVQIQRDPYVLVKERLKIQSWINVSELSLAGNFLSAYFDWQQIQRMGYCNLEAGNRESALTGPWP